MEGGVRPRRCLVAARVARLLSSFLEFVLAYDWRETYGATAHLFFAGAADPSGAKAIPIRCSAATPARSPTPSRWFISRGGRFGARAAISRRAIISRP